MKQEKKNEIFFDNENNNRIYFNEFLTSNRKRLLVKAKLFAKSNDYKYVWSRGGKIFIRKSEGDVLKHINNLSDIAKVGVGEAGLALSI